MAEPGTAQPGPGSTYLWGMKCILIGAVLAALAAGCDRKQEIDGIAPNWIVDKTKRSDFNGVCNPHDDTLIMCQVFGVKAPLGNHGANISMYFAGDDPDATLVELLLDVPGCRPDELQAWLKSQLGDSPETTGNLAIWKGKNTTKLAQLPAQPARCEVNFVSNKDPARIAQIKSDALERAAE
jgi:hypothetical protein